LEPPSLNSCSNKPFALLASAAMIRTLHSIGIP
jgi:hypothetical protein